jgi:N-acetylgalactosamine-6-sulfatase
MAYRIAILLFVRAAAALWTLSESCATAAEKGAAPNILFLLADDLGYGDLGCYGHPRIQTPHLDQLAREGIRFTQFYACTLCSPTRAAAITGQFPSRWRIVAHLSSLQANMARAMPHWLDRQAPSMPRALNQSGYRTAHFGKWHLGGGSGSFREGELFINHPDAPPVANYGFDVVRATFGNGPTWKRALPVGKPHELYPYDEPEWQMYSSRAIADAAIEFLDNHAKQHRSVPFLAHVWFKDPHTPMKASAAQRAAYPGAKEPAQTHYAMVSYLDEQIGRILSKLGGLGLHDSTLVLFASDNGGVVNRGASNGSLRGGKWTLYEGGVRVPCIVRWPGRAPAGRVDQDSVLSVWDLAPTFCKLAGAAMPQGYRSDGDDASAALDGRTFERASPLLWHHPTGADRSPTLAIRQQHWKLLMDPDGGRQELYDLANDPGEQHNVAPEQPEVLARLAKGLLAWHRSLPTKVGRLAN